MIWGNVRGAHHDSYRTDDGTVILVLAYPTSPLPANGSRGSHWTRARLVRDVRATSAWLAARAIPYAQRPLPRITVELEQTVTDHRRRDADNLVPLMKALVDGLTTAGVIEDDHDGIVTRRMPTIRRDPDPQAVPHFELTIRTISKEHACAHR